MNETSRRQFFVLGAALLAAASVGCTATSKFMHPTSAAVAPSEERATVFFIRPSGYAQGMLFTVIDEQGKFVGDSTSQSHFAVQVPAGPHVFIAWAENTAALKADLVAGRTYYVEVAPKFGVLSARAHLLALTPRSENWAKVPEWLSTTAGYTPDPAAGQAYLDDRREDTSERVRRGLDALTKYSPEELAERVLRPEDGR